MVKYTGVGRRGKRSETWGFFGRQSDCVCTQNYSYSKHNTKCQNTLTRDAESIIETENEKNAKKLKKSNFGNNKLGRKLKKKKGI